MKCRQATLRSSPRSSDGSPVSAAQSGFHHSRSQAAECTPIGTSPSRSSIRCTPGRDVLRDDPVGRNGDAAEAVEVVPLVVGETQGPGERTEQLRRRVPGPALLQPHEVFDADPGEHRQLFAAEAGRASSRAGRQPGLLAG